MSVQRFHFDDASSCFDLTALAIIEKLQSAISARGHALMAVSGGKSPEPLFERLSRADIDWHKVTITLVDERFVSGDHSDRNDALVHKALLRNHAKAATFIALVPAHLSAGTTTNEQLEACAASAETQLKKLDLPFDVLVLGMGDDGHTASWFPDAVELNAMLDLRNENLVSVCHPPKAPHARITLTAHAVLQSRHLFLLITGKTKLVVLERALAAATPESELPVRLPLHQRDVPVSIYSCS